MPFAKRKHQEIIFPISFVNEVSKVPVKWQSIQFIVPNEITSFQI